MKKMFCYLLRSLSLSQDSCFACRVLSIRTIRHREEFGPTSLTHFLTVQAVPLSSSWFLVLHQTQGKKTSFFSSFPNEGWCITYMSYYVVKLCLSGLSRTTSVLSQKSSGFVHKPFLWSCLLSSLRKGVGWMRLMNSRR